MSDQFNWSDHTANLDFVVAKAFALSPANDNELVVFETNQHATARTKRGELVEKCRRWVVDIFGASSLTERFVRCHVSTADDDTQPGFTIRGARFITHRGKPLSVRICVVNGASRISERGRREEEDTQATRLARLRVRHTTALALRTIGKTIQRYT